MKRIEDTLPLSHRAPDDFVLPLIPQGQEAICYLLSELISQVQMGVHLLFEALPKKDQERILRQMTEGPLPEDK